MTDRRAQHRGGVAMERSTVQNTSYRPIPVSARRRPPRIAPAQRRVPFGTATVYREAYYQKLSGAAAAAVGPTRSTAQRDHAFLAGDRTSRFRDTSYRMDYSAPKASSTSSQKRGNDHSCITGVAKLFFCQRSNENASFSCKNRLSRNNYFSLRSPIRTGWAYFDTNYR